MKTMTNLHRFLATVVLTVVSTVAGWAIYYPSIYWDENTKTITMSHDDNNVKIYYTVDGSTPTTSSYLYTAPFVVNRNLDIRAIAVKGDDVSSANSYNVSVNSRFFQNGIYYQLVDNTLDHVLEVTQRLTGRYEGKIVIPPTAEYEGEPYTVIRIGYNAFQNADYLTGVVMPSTITSIGYQAFNSCDGLTDIVLPANVKTIESRAFNGCYNLKNITLNEGLETIENTVFYDCDIITSITLPSTLKTLGNEVFMSCDQLKNMTIPDGVTSIGNSLFEGCPSLVSVKLPATLSAIPQNMFYGCTSLRSIDIPSTVKSIGEDSFRNCDALTSVIIPEGVETLGDRVFMDCNNLLSVSIPEGITVIPYGAFDDDYALTTVSLPSTLNTIGERAFNTCRSLTTITIPENVSSIAKYAFTECEKLTSIYCLPMTPPTMSGDNDGNAFYDALERATLYVKTDALNNYKKSSRWNEFQHKQTVDNVLCEQPTFALTDYMLTMSTTTAGATIYYTTDGTDPTSLSMKYTAPIPFMQNGTIRAIAVKDGMDNSAVSEFVKTNYKAPIPVATMDENFVVTINCETPQMEGFPENKIYYILDNSSYQWYETIAQGRDDWQLYEGPIQLSQPRYVHAYVVRDGWIDSERTVSDFYGDYFTTTPWYEWVSDKGKLHLYNIDPGATVYYTLDGSDPTKDSYVYNPEDSITIDHNLTVKWVAMRDNRFNSEIGSCTISGITTKFVDGDITYRCIDGNPAQVVEVTSNLNSYKYYTGDVVIPPTATRGGTTYQVIRIGEDAFKNCSDLTSITLPETVTSIGTNAFYNASKLEKIEFTGSEISLDFGAFEGCRQLKDVIFHGQLTKMDPRAFAYCSALESITIPGGFTRIEGSSFYDNTNLKNISIPEGVVYIGEHTFDGCSSLTTIQLPSTMQKIDHWAFMNSAIQSIVIPDNVTYLGNEVFSRCTALTSVTLPAQLETLGSSAFSGCNGLRSISLPEGFKSISNRTFDSCTGLTTVQLPSTLTSIGEHAFERCSALRTITLPESVTKIEANAFSNCSALESVYALPITPPNTTGGFAFIDQITSATLFVQSSAQNNYKSDNIWCQFNNIQSITQIPTGQPTFVFDATNYTLSIVSQDANAKIYYTRDNSEPTVESELYSQPIPFMQNDTVKAIAVTSGLAPSLVSEFRKNDLKVDVPTASLSDDMVLTISYKDPIEGLAPIRVYYQQSTWWDSEYIFHNEPWTLYEGPVQMTEPRIVRVKAERDGWLASDISSGYDYKTNYSLNAPQINWEKNANTGTATVTLSYYNVSSSSQGDFYYTLDGTDPTKENGTLYTKPFEVVRNLTVKAVAVMDKHFNSSINTSEITGLESKFLVDGIYYRLKDQTLLDEVEVASVPSGINNYSGSITINPTVTYNEKEYTVLGIYENAFKGSNIKSILLPDGLRTIGNKAFDGCQSLSEIEIPSSVESLGEGAFDGCYELNKVTLHDGLKTIGKEAFQYCRKLGTIALPNTLTTIGYSTFSGCTGLTTVTWPASVNTIEDNMFYGCEKLTNITLPSTLTTIKYSAFYDCQSLQSITLPESLTEIGYEAFRNCRALTSIVIPNSVKKIESGTFYSCSSLVSIMLPSQLEEIANSVFYNCSSLASITMPATLTKIGSSAFNYCSAISSVYAQPTIPPSAENGAGLEWLKDQATLYVLPASKKSYSEASYWAQFKTISEFTKIAAEQPAFVLQDFKLSLSTITAGGTIYYTRDGSKPTTQSLRYTEPLIFTQNDTVKAITVAEGLENSLIAEYKKDDFKVAQPQSTLDEETFKVTITCETPEAEGMPETRIWYAINQSSYTPDAKEYKLYDGQPIQMTEPGYIHMYAERDGWLTSERGYDNYHGNYLLDEPYLSWDSEQKLMTITPQSEVDAIYYTIDNSEPSKDNGILYTKPFTIERNLTVKAVAVKDKHFNSKVKTYKVTGLNSSFMVDGIAYRLADNTLEDALEVTSGSDYAETIVIPESVTYNGVTYPVVRIGDNAFSGRMGDATKKYILPKTIKTIGDQAFYGNYNVKEIVLNEGLETIGNSAFGYNYELEEIVIPSTVKIIGESAFSTGYDRAINIFCYARKPEIHENTFGGRTQVATLNVYTSQLSDFQNADYWKDFKTIKTFDMPTVYHPNFKLDLAKYKLAITTPTEGATIYYTRDGSDPTTNSLIYTDSLIFNQNDTVRAMAVKNGMQNSAVIEFKKNDFKVAAPVATIDTETFQVTINCENSDVEGMPETRIWYVIDQSYSNRSEGFTLYDGEPIQMTEPGIIHMYAERDGWIMSDQRYDNFYTDYSLTTPSISWDSETKTFTLTHDDNEVAFYYTLDGSEPTKENGILYTEPVTLVRNLVIKAIAVKAAHFNSKVQDYTVTGVDSRFMYDGLAYRLVDNTTEDVVEVTIGGNVSGKFSIPEKVNDTAGKTYTVVRVGNSAFYGEHDITDVTLPESIKSIGDRAFFGCSLLTTINLPDALTEIGSEAFNGADLSSIVVPGGVKRLSERAFRYNQNAKSVVLKSGVEEIGDYAFAYVGMQNLELPSTLTKIGNSAFWQCNKLLSVNIPDGVTVLEGTTFESCSALETVILPSTLSHIKHSAFNGCSSLVSVILPESLKIIEDGAFINCVSLGHVYSLAVTPPSIDSGDAPFAGVADHATLYVKPQSEAIYSQTPNWGAFSKIETFENLPCEKPVFVYDNYRLTISSETEGVNIYYTLDGTEPTTSSLLYKEPVAIAKNDTILAMAISDEWGRSLTSEWKKNDLQVANPVATISDDFIVTVTCEEPDVEGLPATHIYYSLNRSSWNGGAAEDWKLYTEPLKLTVANYLHVRAEREGWINSGQSDFNYYSNYYLEKPSISPSNTSISYMPKDSTITISHSDSEAQLYYTLDGSDPNENGILYTGPFNPGHNVKVVAIAKRPGYISSDPDEREYKWFTVATPQIAIEHLAAVITTEKPASTTIYYTLDNTTPTRESNVYTKPIVMDKNYTIRAMAIADNWNDSQESMFDFYTRDYTVGTPQFSPVEYGSISESADSTFTITSATQDATIYYTLDGSTPTIQSAKYEGPVKLTQNVTVKALAVKTDMFNSVISEVPVSWFTVKTPRITFNGKYVIIDTETSGTSIHYTTDNSDPDTKSKAYLEPFSLPAEQTIVKAIAIRENWNNSSVMERTYNPGKNYCETPGITRIAGTNKVQMTTRTEGAKIYFTNDGLNPTISSSLYNAETGLEVTENCTLKAMAVDSLLYDSEVTTFVVDWFKTDQPVITVDGIFVTITAPKENSRVYYTLDGSEPTTESTLYEGTLTMKGSGTIKAIAAFDNFNNSSVAVFNYYASDYTCGLPTFTRDGNTVSIASAPAEGTTIYYTLDGTTPTTASSVFTEPIAVDHNITIKAMAMNNKLFTSEVADYEVNWFTTDAPVIAFDGIFATMTCTTPNSRIYYTLDGSTPTAESFLFTSAVTMTGSCTVKAIAVRDNFNNSAVTSMSFDKASNTVSTPQFTKNDNAVSIKVTQTEGTTIYYTLDGTTPTTASAIYTEPVQMTENCTLKVLAMNDKLFTSEVAEYEVNWFKVETPVIAFDGIFATMTCATPNSRIYYTLDGTSPTAESFLFTSAVTMTASCTVKAIAIRDNFNNSAVTSVSFDKASNTVAMPQFKRNGNLITITTTTETEGTTIYYTVDGSDPTAESAVYSEPVQMVENCTLKAVALNEKLFTSEISSFNIDWFKVETPVLAISGNTLTMSCATPGAVIYYEYDDVPTLKSAVYNGPITLVDNRSVFAIAVKMNFNDSEMAGANPDIFVCTEPTFAYNGRYLQVETGEGMTIHYTTDGSKPTEDSEVYTGQIEIEDVCTVRAIATRKDFRDSPESSYTVTYVYTGEGASQSEAGHLEDMFQWIGTTENVENLPVSGKVNADDLKFIRGIKSLRHLDMTEATYEGTALPDEAFAGMDLISFQSPKQLNSVGEHLFRGCNKLAAIVWNANIAIPESVTDDVKSNANFLLYVNSRIHVPSSYTGNVISGGQATSITLSDAGSGNFCCPQRFYTQRISYTHTYSQKTESGVTCGWETLALPFDVQSITHERRGSLAPFSAQEDYSLYKPFWLYELEETGFSDATEIKAYTPYIISMPNNPKYADDFILAGKVTFSAADTYIEADTAMVTMKGSVRFAPAMQRQEKSSSVLAINLEDCEVDGVFYRSGSAFLPNLRTVNPFEAYALVGTSILKMPLADMNWGYVTDIRNAQMSELEAIGRKGGVYDLLGRKLSNDSSHLKSNGKKHKRVYIINGKKTVVE